MVKNPLKKGCISGRRVAVGRNSHESRCKNHNFQALAKFQVTQHAFNDPFKKASAEPGTVV